jgi:hypothetical protein
VRQYWERKGAHRLLLVGFEEPRGLEPPSSCSKRVQGFVASFRVDPLNRGLEPPSN